MSEVVTAEQIAAFRTNGFIVVDDLLTDAELDTFEPLVTAAVAYPLGRREAHARGTLAIRAVHYTSATVPAQISLRRWKHVGHPETPSTEMLRPRRASPTRRTDR